MKKYIVYAIVVLWGIVGIQRIQAKYSGQNESIIVDAFVGFQLNNPEGIIESTGLYNGEYLDMADRVEVLMEVANELGITSGYELNSYYENGRAISKLTKEAKQAMTTIWFATIEDDALADDELSQYLLIRIEISEDLKSAMAYQNKAADLMKNYADNGRTTLSLNGSYDGQLSLAQRDQAADALLGKMEAKIVSQHREMDLYTIYAYTKQVDQYQRVDGKKVNINIAVSYDEEKNETNLYMGTPLIYSDY